jgi:hypothetical protein
MFAVVFKNLDWERRVDVKVVRRQSLEEYVEEKKGTEF